MKRELLKKAISFSKAGFKTFKCSGKVPAVQWKQHPYIEPDELEEYLESWTGNYGIAPNKNQLVIDIDPRNFKQGDMPHKRLFKAAGIDPKNFSTTVQSGGGGLHLYLTLPSLPAGFHIGKHHPDYIGIDFISEGAYVIGPGSTHPETNNIYTMFEHYPHPHEMAVAPQALIDIITKERAQPVDLGGIDESREDDQQAILRYTDFLQRAEPAVEGTGGDAHTYAIACKGRDFGLTAHTVLDLLMEEWNPRCHPEWTVEQLAVKVKNAFQYASNDSVGVDHPEADFEPIHKAEDGKAIERHERWRGWDRRETGELKPTLNNAVNFFINHHEDPDNVLLNSIIFDTFSGEIVKTKWMPWDRTDGRRFPKAGIRWSDEDSAGIKHYFSSQKRFNLGINDLEQALTTVAHMKERHPVKDYLRELTWDGKARLESWLIRISDAKDNRVTRALSKIMIIQAVNRIYNPGCQADIVVVLEGAQGIGKSRLVELLGGEYYCKPFIDPGNKDTADTMRGSWFIEMAEMAVYGKKDAGKLKDFITTRIDEYRPAYARRSKKFPRQSVLVGTFNPDATGEYLTDTTGNRRFGPIDLGNKMITEKHFIRNRDQIFAEAVHLILNGAPTYIDDAQVLRELQREQEKRLSTDSFSSPIIDYIEKNQPYSISTSDIWVKALMGDVKNCTISHQRRIASVLRELGYFDSAERKGRVQRKVYKNNAYKRNKTVEDIFGE